jgi:assimilatory nitrate reductase catalytic subunit
VRSTARLYLTTGRVLEHYQSGAQTRRVPELVAGSSTAYAQIHPLTAQSLGIEEGLRVRITSARGECVVPARLSVDIRPDVIFVPFHFPGEQRVNSLTSDAVDPISGMPEFKACAVDVRLDEHMEASRS